MFINDQATITFKCFHKEIESIDHMFWEPIDSIVWEFLIRWQKFQRVLTFNQKISRGPVVGSGKGRELKTTVTTIIKNSKIRSKKKL